VDRAIHTAAPEQRGIRGVYDRIDLLAGDVALCCLGSRHAQIM